jgi:hypothetical protein
LWRADVVATVVADRGDWAAIVTGRTGGALSRERMRGPLVRLLASFVTVIVTSESRRDQSVRSREKPAVRM